MLVGVLLREGHWTLENGKTEVGEGHGEKKGGQVNHGLLLAV